MSAIKGRAKRTSQEPVVILQARVSPTIRAKAHEAAAALGISVAAYVEQLIAHEQLDETGRPVWWPETPHPHQEELPLSRSA
ncbi:toxin-antitoxin system HicB family antitoxin [Jannaschia sp. R86511]|uniref:toxin-antitoxin system HicB family antitoxin n=1 Tax=Jannaschia sp. R86511 TaxID=3093853 RepID=UPI0036D29E81